MIKKYTVGLSFIAVAALFLSCNSREVEINGVVWAVNNNRNFQTAHEPYGDYYYFQTAQLNCPEGWRTPTEAEFQRLVDSGSEWTTVKGVPGRLFGSGDNTLFLPAGGRADPDLMKGWGEWDKKDITLLDTCGYYWGNEDFCMLCFTKEIVHVVHTNFYTAAFSVRCVKE